MGNDSHFLSSIEKLKGCENYTKWKFAIRTYLEHTNLWKAVEGTETDAGKISKARTTIILSVDSDNYVHIQETTTAKEVWDRLKTLFEDKGRMRRMGLIHQLCGTKLENCESMREYIATIVNAAQQLNSIDFKVDDEWLANFLLYGLPESYKPMVMALDNTENKLTSDVIKTKLLQEDSSSNTGGAFFSKTAGNNFKRGNEQKKSPKKKNNIRCYTCKKKGHKSPDCPNKKKDDKNSTKDNSDGKAGATFSAVFLTGNFNRGDWYIDSGATQHLTMNRDWIFNAKQPAIPHIIAANNERMKIDVCGSVKLLADVDGEPKCIEVNDVLCIPDLTANLLSVSKLAKHGHSTKFFADRCEVRNESGNLLAIGTLIDGLYRLNGMKQCSYIAVASRDSSETWHRRLGHLNYFDLQKMASGAVDGISFAQHSGEDVCVTCSKGKHSRLPFNKHGSRANKILEIVHADLAGPMETKSLGDARYMLVLVDDFSRMTFGYFLKSKDEAFSKFCEFKSFVEKQTGEEIKKFRSDNGTEFCNQHFEKLFKSCGIERQTSTPYTPQQNGLAERTIRTLTERARCMLQDTDLPKKFWAEAMGTATYLKNRSVSRVLDGKTPYEIWTGSKPNLSHLRIFGSRAMAHVPDEKRKKFDPKSKELIFVGYCDGTKGYRLYDPDTNRAINTRDVIFLESTRAHDVKSDGFPLHGIDDGEEDHVVAAEDNNENFELLKSSLKSDDDSLNELIDSYRDAQSSDVEEDLNGLDNAEDESSVLRRSQRQPKPRKFPDYVTYLTCDHIDEPSTVEDALKSANRSDWEHAMNEEYLSLIGNRTWELVELPSDRKAINSKWVFKVKTDSEGNVSRFKARLVAKGCSQRAGIDYEETFSPVVRYSSIRLLIALASKFDLDIDQMDAVTAFLQGDVEEKIYMKQPEGFDDGSGRVCLLRKAIYGLKQASRQWNVKLNEVLLNSGYRRCKTDPCIYFRREKRSMIYVAVYVDDFLIFSNNNAWKNQLKANLTKNFSMKDLGQASSCIGMQITRNRKTGTITLDQRKYTEAILQKFGMGDCNPVASPVDPNSKLTKNMAAKTKDEIQEMRDVPYQEAVGSILYLAQCTRPDINFAISNVSKYNNHPGRAHWNAVKRIFRYLRKTSDYKLTYQSGRENSELHGFSDADWASDVDDRRSCTGYVFMLENCAISWASKKQPTVALSSAEAEYMALSSATQEAIWIRQLLGELIGVQQPIKIFVDNQSAINLAKNHMYSPRTKHIDIRHHFVREKLSNHVIDLEYIGTDQMTADNLTKAVKPDKQIFCTANSMGFTQH